MGSVLLKRRAAISSLPLGLCAALCLLIHFTFSPGSIEDLFICACLWAPVNMSVTICWFLLQKEPVWVISFTREYTQKSTWHLLNEVRSASLVFIVSPFPTLFYLDDDVQRKKHPVHHREFIVAPLHHGKLSFLILTSPVGFHSDHYDCANYLKFKSCYVSSKDGNETKLLQELGC